MSHDLRLSCDRVTTEVTIGTPGTSILMQKGSGTGAARLDAEFIAVCLFASCPQNNLKLIRHAKQLTKRNPGFRMTPQPDNVIRSSGLEKTVPGPRQSKILP